MEVGEGAGVALGVGDGAGAEVGVGAGVGDWTTVTPSGGRPQAAATARITKIHAKVLYIYQTPDNPRAPRVKPIVAISAGALTIPKPPCGAATRGAKVRRELRLT